VTVLRKGSRGLAVVDLQRRLGSLVLVSGTFDPVTDELVRRYQRSSGLDVDGVVGDETSGALVADSELWPGPIPFKGSHGLLCAWEGLEAGPYVPFGSDTSGVTVGFGYDMRHQSAADLRRIFAGTWADALLDELCGAVGLKGPAARAWLAAHPPTRWPLTAEQAGRVLPLCAARYWAAAVAECPELPEMPPAVHTVLLSATYSLWVAPVRSMRAALRRGDWAAAARSLAAQGGDPERRAAEAALLRAA
jgi:hypothetical protein